MCVWILCPANGNGEALRQASPKYDTRFELPGPAHEIVDEGETFVRVSYPDMLVF